LASAAARGERSGQRLGQAARPESARAAAPAPWHRRRAASDDQRGEHREVLGPCSLIAVRPTRAFALAEARGSPAASPSARMPVSGVPDLMGEVGPAVRLDGAAAHATAVGRARRRCLLARRARLPAGCPRFSAIAPPAFELAHGDQAAGHRSQRTAPGCPTVPTPLGGVGQRDSRPRAKIGQILGSRPLTEPDHSSDIAGTGPPAPPQLA